MDVITEPAKQIPVSADADLCVVGGGCTGVFAAIRAARLGLSVILLEQQNRLGGTAVGGLVNIWHSLYDTTDTEQIIAGLTAETVERLRKRGDLCDNGGRHTAYNFNPNALCIALDRMTEENRVRVLLHTAYSASVFEDGRLSAIFVETVEGRKAVRARFFIDATGDGRLAKDAGMTPYAYPDFQPASACFHLLGNTDGIDLRKLIAEHGREFGLSDDWGWHTFVAGCENLSMRADSHVFHARCDRAEDLTRAEIEGRRQADAFVSLLNAYGGKEGRFALTGLCARIGVRETVHFPTRFRAEMMPLLTGERYEDPIMNGTYRVDIHHADDRGITFRDLDGTETTVYGKGTRTVRGNWRDAAGLTSDPARYYQVPFEILVGEQAKNLIAVGRMINADRNAFGALRVMVNLNQLGEAAGVAAYLCLSRRCALTDLDGKSVTKTLRDGGSAL